MSTKKNIAFWGTPELTIKYLDALLYAEVPPVVIITNPDRPKGRGHELAPTPAKTWGIEHEIPVLQPEKLDADFITELKSFDLDLSVVVAYGSILSQELIDLPKKGTLNVHYSLLPKLRGASPTETAILEGHTEIGCSIQVMAKALDSGPIIAEEKTQIGNDETTTDLRGRLTDIGASLLIQAIPKYLDGELVPKNQDDTSATYCGKIKKEDGEINLSGDPVVNYRKYRAYVEWPRTYFFTEKDSKKIRVIITKAKFEDGQFVIEKVLPEGKKEIAYGDFLKNQK